jgi:hypothetical protein
MTLTKYVRVRHAQKNVKSGDCIIVVATRLFKLKETCFADSKNPGYSAAALVDFGKHSALERPF